MHSRIIASVQSVLSQLAAPGAVRSLDTCPIPNCLTLNVFSPRDGYELDKDFRPKPLPVVVLLHGGDFHHGSGADFGFFGPIHSLVSQGHVVVTLNYRINSFGGRA